MPPIPPLNLRRQLMLVSLLLLTLPWAGCQFIREMEGALRQGQEQSLQATARAVAAVLGEREDLLYPNPERRTAPADRSRPVYAHPSERVVIVDGYADGWEDIGSEQLSSEPGRAPLTVKFQAATRGDMLYLMLKVKDQQVVFHNPGLSPELNGDRLVLRTWRDGGRQEYIVATAAPGRVRAYPVGPLQPGFDAGRIRGYWQDSANGYSLELEIPLAYTGGRLGFYLVNVGHRPGGKFETLGNIDPLNALAPPWLIYNPTPLQQTLQPFNNSGSQLQVVDKDNWLIADMPALSTPAGKDAKTFWLLRILYRSILSRDTLEAPPKEREKGRVEGEEVASALAGIEAHSRYKESDASSRTLLSTAVPIVYEDAVIGAVVARQSGEQYLSLTDQAFSRLLGYSLLALSIGALGLLGYASLLSWRIGKLSRAARQAHDQDGPGPNPFPRSAINDEIGELSRHYADLLDKLREYNDYLRTLSRKLSHELRTPIAVIKTSLENLEQAAPTSPQSDVYLARAREGLIRLNSILTAMSEANRLEESIRGNQPGEIDLIPLLEEVFAAYEAVYPDQALHLDLPPQPVTVSAVPELLVQALDKLVENAVSFCSPEGRVTIALASTANHWELSVSNDGAPLPQELQARLFDPMVSVRSGDSSEVHLGLGLHIVRLIAEFHRGQLRAENLPGSTGVRVSLALPRISLPE